MSNLTQFASGAIKQTQRGTAFLGPSAYTLSVTLSPTIAIAKTQVRMLGALYFYGAWQGYEHAMVYLVDASTLKVDRSYSSASGSCQVSWELTEYY